MTRQLLCTAAVAAATFVLADAAGAQWDDRQADVSYHDVELTDAALRSHVRELEVRNSELEAAVAEMGGGCGCCLSPAGWFDPCCCGPTWSFSLNGDGWTDHGEVFDSEDNFGNRFTLEATWDLNDSGVRGHLGGGYGIYNYHGRRGQAQGRDDGAEQQVYLTAGLYRRGSGCCGDCWTWGLAYDYLHDNHYGSFANAVELNQFRFLVGRLIDPCNELGVWGAVGLDDDDLLVFRDRTLAEVEAQDQIHLYWRRYYDFGGETMLYAGLTSPNASFFQRSAPVLDSNDDLTEAVIGLRGIAPLTCNVGLVGGFHYLIPSARGGLSGARFTGRSAAEQETWNVTFGVVWVRGCSLPVLPVADNGWMTKRVVQTAPFPL